jgi:hypothetical protein
MNNKNTFVVSHQQRPLCSLFKYAEIVKFQVVALNRDIENDNRFEEPKIHGLVDLATKCHYRVVARLKSVHDE